MKYLFAFCFAGMIPLAVHARGFSVLHYSVEEGLPSTTVYSAYHDKMGFLWLATDKGIARYNGLRFETFTTADGLPDNEIFFFREDHEGRLWLGTYNGELCFYKGGVFHTAANTPYLRMAKPQTHLYNITVERDSSITFNFYDPFVVANLKGERLSVYNFSTVKHPSAHPYVYYKRKISEGVYSMIYEEVVLTVDTLNNVLNTQKRKWPGVSVYVQVQDTGYFINIPSDLQRYYGHLSCIQSPELDSITSFSDSRFNGKRLRAYYTDGVNRFFATNDGLAVNQNTWLLPGSDISSVTQDGSGHYWVTTLNRGVFRLNKNFLNTSVLDDAYAGDIKFVGVAKGGVFFVPKNNNLYNLSKSNLSCVFDYATLTKGRDLFLDDAFFLDPAGEYFLDFKTSVYILANLKTPGAKIFYHDRDSNRFKGVKEVYVDGDSLCLFGRSNVNIFSLDAIKKGTAKFHYKFDGHEKRFYGIAADPVYGVWFSTSTSVYAFRNGDVTQLPQYRNVAFKNFIFLGDKIVGTTFRNELLIVSNVIGHVKIDTIPQQACVWGELYKLDDTHVLLSSSNLFYILDVNGTIHEIYAVENLFVPGQTNAVCIDSGYCYFFKNGDIVSMPVSDLQQKAMPPRLYFTSIRAGKKQLYNSGDVLDGDLELSYNDARSIVVSFTKVLVGGRTVIQQYCISKNGQDIWQDVKGDDITLASPGYGDYIIKVRARTLSSGYCTPVAIRLHILRPYWASWWFVGLAIVLLAVLVIVIVRSRISYIVRKNKKDHQNEMKFVKSEYKALNALMNPHFVFNTLNNVQGLVNRDDKLAANEYIRVFADLIRQNMHNLSKEVITLQKEMELVVNYLLLEKLRFKELLNYSIEVDDNVDLSEIFIPPLLVQPLVENSVKHGILPLESVEGKVVIRIYEREHLLFIEVRDNGVGLAKAGKNQNGDTHESFAMENIKKRIEQLAIILDKQITLDMKEEKLAGEHRQWTVVTISMSLA